MTDYSGVFYILNEEKEIVMCKDAIVWSKWFENGEGRRVAQTSFKDDVSVSTVCLGIDHGFGGTPLFFETMVFGGLLDGEQDRYATWEEAEVGHKKMVERVNEI